MKKLILGIIIGLSISTAISAVNIEEKWERINDRISTCVVKTNEGHYRLFIYHDYMSHGLVGGITAVKIR